MFYRVLYLVFLFFPRISIRFFPLRMSRIITTKLPSYANAALKVQHLRGKYRFYHLRRRNTKQRSFETNKSLANKLDRINLLDISSCLQEWKVVTRRLASHLTDTLLYTCVTSTRRSSHPFPIIKLELFFLSSQ